MTMAFHGTGRTGEKKQDRCQGSKKGKTFLCQIFHGFYPFLIGEFSFPG
jgi:hypothetical protein